MSSEIKIKKVVLFSSEDKKFKAENLLNSNTDAVCKWIGEKDGNTKQFILVQLDKPTEIHQIDIENESSGIIQITAGNEADLEEDYCEILPQTSFMSPNESKNGINTNRLKIFTDETGLNKKFVSKTFEYVKIACQQPYNKEIQFGISSIRMYNKRVLKEELSDAPKINTGVFSLKKELSNSPAPAKDDKKEDENKAAMFQKWKNLDATKNEAETLKRKKPAASDDENENKPKNSAEKSESESPRKKPDVLAKQNSNKHQPKQQILKGVIFALSGFQNPLRSEIRDTGMKLGAKYRPDWTDDCTHLISAFSNTPKANQVRKDGGFIVTKEWIYESEKKGAKADEEDFKFEEESDEDSDDESKPRKAARNANKKMSKLKKDLADSYDEEEAENSDDKDFIVDDDEIEFEDDMVIDDDVSEDESEDSDDSDDSDSAKKSKKKKKKANGKKNKSKKVEKKPKKAKKKSKSSSESSSDSESDLEAYKKKQEQKLLKEKEKKAKKEKSDEDTVSPKSPKAKKPNAEKKKGIKYEDSEEEGGKSKAAAAAKPQMKKNESTKTEVNSDLEAENGKKSEDDESWKLPSFFDDKNFFIIGDYDQKRRKELNKIIIAYGGNVHSYMSSDIDFVITDKNWNKDFEESKKENAKLLIVNDDWLDACNRRKKLVAHIPFEVGPDV